MDVNDLLTALNGVLDLGDTLDNNGIGISAMTNWQHTTRELCKMELGSFLLYVGAGGGFFNDGQAGLVNLLLSDKYGQIPSWQMKSVADELDMPIAANNATFAAFKNGDDALSQQNGAPTKQFTDLLISLYESFGGLMVAFNENALSRVRCDTYVNGLKARQGSSTSSTSSAAKTTTTKTAAAKSTVGANIDVSPYIPVGVTLTDNQKEYLAGVVGCMQLRHTDGVPTSAVADYMNKTSSAVSSGVRTLVKKGILEINDDAEIVIAKEKPAPAAVKTSGSAVGKGKPANKSGSARLDSRISFDLSGNYKTSEDKDNDGKKQLKIELNPRKENGADKNDASFVVSVVSGEESGKDILDEIDEKNEDVTVKRRYNSDPEAILLINQMNMSVLGVALVISIYRLFIRLSENQALLIFRNVTGNDETAEDPLEQMLDVWRALRIDGEKVKAGDIDSGDIAAESKKHLEDEIKYDDEELDNTVQTEGNLIRIGGRWEMRLPFSWRAVAKQEEDAEHVTLSIYTDYIPLGHAALGNTVGMQKKCNVAMEAVTLTKTLKAAKIADNAVIRDDDRMKVTLTSYICNDGSAIAHVKVVEKEFYNNEIVFCLVMTSKIDDLPGALEKIKEKNYILGHPFGLEYENNWMGVLKLAASIRPVDEGEAEIELQARTTLFKGISGCMPKDMKLLKGGKDNPDAWYPAKGKPSRKEFEDNEWDCYMKVFTSDGSDLGKIDERIADNVQAGIYSRFMVRANDGPALERISECYTERGYKSLWLNPPVQGVVLSAYTGNFDHVLIEIVSETQKPAAEMLRIGQAVFDSIEIDGESVNVCAPPFPPETDLFHEHYDLVESGQYTTHRDADFVGQSIRELMKKHGNLRKAEYKLMEIKDDTYDLDREALALAKVFRLNENLFDPYGDTEALIRKAMFRNAGAFQVLRSLAWCVSALADRENRPLEDYSYEELERIGDLITEQNNLVYQAFSYCAGLCNHYDWHVFYVPDAYLSRDDDDRTDLRYLTGKENRGGNSITIFGGIGGLGNMRRVSDLIGRNEETLESLEAMRKDLEDLLPVMRTIYNGLIADRDRSQKLEGPLPDALTAWCALAIAAKEPFYSEEAADTPEADAGMDGPLQRPTDSFDDKPIGGTKKPAAKKTPVKPAAKKTTTKATKSTTDKTPEKTAGTAARKAGTKPKTTKEASNASSSNPAVKPAASPAAPAPAAKASSAAAAEESAKPANENVRILDFDGETFLDGVDYMSDTDPRPIVIPEGVTQIGDSYFSDSCMESVTLPSTLRILGHHVFTSNPNLKKVELNEGLEQIDAMIVSECPLMTEITLPDSIRKVDNYAFLYEYSDTDQKSNITVRLSGKLARYLVANNVYKQMPAILAKDFIIDGVRYRSLEEYVQHSAPRPVAAPKPVQAPAATQGADDQKERQRNHIRGLIRDLEKERDAIKGLFAGMRRNKIQKQIDELKAKLRQIQ